MAKLTVAQIKQQILALEAKAQRIAADDMKASVSKVHALMGSLGVTLEHLGAKVSKKVSSSKRVSAGKNPAASKRAGAGAARYRDPVTGATWSGFGRAPGWIAAAVDRDAYLVTKTTAAKAAKKVASAGKKGTTAARKAVTSAKKAVAKTVKTKPAKKTEATVKSPAAKQASSATKTARKAASRKSATKKPAVYAPVASSDRDTPASGE